MTTAKRYRAETLPPREETVVPPFGPEHLPMFKALNECIGGKDRPMLDSVFIEIHNDATFLVSTNGHVLLCIETNPINNPEGDWRKHDEYHILLAGASVAQFIDSKGHTELVRSHSGYDFPDVRQVFPAEFNEPSSYIGFSAKYLDPLNKVLKALKLSGRGKTTPITLQHSDPLAPAVFSFDGDDKLFRSASLIIMPVRLDG